MIKHLALLAAAACFAACDAAEDIPTPALPPVAPPAAVDTSVCRPADMPASKLVIGEIEFPEGLKSVHAFTDTNGFPAVQINLNADQAKQFGDYTAEHQMEVMEIKVDGEVISAPRIAGPIYGGGVQITGSFTQQEAQDLALKLAPPCEAN